jgi:hypothetical protein
MISHGVIYWEPEPSQDRRLDAWGGEREMIHSASLTPLALPGRAVLPEVVGTRRVAE